MDDITPTLVELKKNITNDLFEYLNIYFKRSNSVVVMDIAKSEISLLVRDALEQVIESNMNSEIDIAVNGMEKEMKIFTKENTESKKEQVVRSSVEDVTKSCLLFDMICDAVGDASTMIADSMKKEIHLNESNHINEISDCVLVDSKKEKKKKSISLFELLDERGVLNERVSSESIVKIFKRKKMNINKKYEEALILFEQVEDIEDISCDWQELKLILRESMSNEEIDVIKFINLHWKFYNLCNNNEKCIDILLNLVIVLLNQFRNCCFLFGEVNFSLKSEKELIIFEQVSTLLKMMYSLGPKLGSLTEANVDLLFITIFYLMRNIVAPEKYLGKNDNIKYRNILLPIHLFALLDPFAKWFLIWVKQVSSLQLVQYLCHTGLLNDILWHCHSYGKIPHSSDETNEELNFHLILDDHHGSLSADNLKQALYIYSLSMLNTILQITKTLFPWSLLSFDDSTKASILCFDILSEDEIKDIHPIQNIGSLRLYLLESTFNFRTPFIPTMDSVLKVTSPFLLTLEVLFFNQNFMDENLVHICSQAFVSVLNIVSGNFQILIQLLSLLLMKIFIPIFQTNSLSYLSLIADVLHACNQLMPKFSYISNSTQNDLTHILKLYSNFNTFFDVVTTNIHFHQLNQHLQYTTWSELLVFIDNIALLSETTEFIVCSKSNHIFEIFAQNTTLTKAHIVLFSSLKKLPSYATLAES